MEIKFTIPGAPKGKGRPRVSIRKFKGSDGKDKTFTKTYTPEDTVIYENLIKLEYQNACNNFKFNNEACLEMEIMAFYPIPKSTTKKKLKLMLWNVLRPIKKPDADNVGKVVADSLNEIAYKDDTQITDLIIRKRYSDVPRVEVRIKDLSDELEIEKNILEKEEKK